MPNPTTKATTAKKMPQLTAGTYTCPISWCEVWRMVSRGRKPRPTAWRVTEKAPEITACEAMTVANVARTTIGIRLQSGNSRKNGLSIAPESSTISAPCPR